MKEMINEYLPLPEDSDWKPWEKELRDRRDQPEKRILVEGFKMMFPDWEDDDEGFLY